MREELYIDRHKEAEMIDKLIADIQINYPDVNASNTLVVNVSPDYSSIIALQVSHALSFEGEIADIMPIDVPYPDEDYLLYKDKAINDIRNFFKYNNTRYKNYILVEAGIIRGGNYTWLTKLLTSLLSGRIITTALYENTGSKFKSDIVGDYYDDTTQDLTFYFEYPNKHWS